MPVKNVKPPASSRTADSAYLSFISGLEIIGLGMKSSQATIDRKALSELQELSEAQEKPIRRLVESYEATAVEANCFDLEGRYRVTVGEGDRLALNIECTFEAHMHSKAPVEKSMAERFAKSDLRFIMLPFARQFVADVTARMNIPPLLLPLATAAGKARAGKPRPSDR